MSGALTYGAAAPDVMTLISGPSGVVAVGSVATPQFAVRVLLPDGVTPVAGLPVTFSTTSGGVQFSGCTATPCIVLTDATGLAFTSVTPTAFGAVTLAATAAGATQSANFTAIARSITTPQTFEYIAAGATALWTPQVNVVQNGAPAAGVYRLLDSFERRNTIFRFEPHQRFGHRANRRNHWPAHVRRTADHPGVCVGQRLHHLHRNRRGSIGVENYCRKRRQPVCPVGGDLQSSCCQGDGRQRQSDGGAPVAIHQAVVAAEMACPTRGACPMAPLLATTTSATTSDANGLISVNADAAYRHRRSHSYCGGNRPAGIRLPGADAAALSDPSVQGNEVRRARTAPNVISWIREDCDLKVRAQCSDSRSARPAG